MINALLLAEDLKPTAMISSQSVNLPANTPVEPVRIYQPLPP